MTSLIKFTPLSGAHDEHPLCYLLEIDDAKILLDCGWSETLNVEMLGELSKVAGSVDAVLLSHPDLSHLGAYPYAYSNLNLNCPTYATIPIHDLGRYTMYDLYLTLRDVEDFKLITLDNIDAAFDNITQVRYSQPIHLQGTNCEGIVITAYNAGHSLGGTIWKIKKDTDEVVYAVDYNHRKDRHLSGSSLMTSDPFSKSTIFITDAYNGLNHQKPRKDIDEAFFATLQRGIDNKSNILIPIDPTTRIFELTYLLEKHWSSNKINVPLYYISHEGSRVMQSAKMMLEWMSNAIGQSFTDRKESPFTFNFLKIVPSLKSIKAEGQKVILSSFGSLNIGPSFDFLQQWAIDPKNMIILPDRGVQGTLTNTLYKHWVKNTTFEDDVGITPTNLDIVLDIVVKARIPLEGEELTQYNIREQERLDLDNAAKERMNMDNESELSDDESEDEMQEILNVTFDMYVKSQQGTRDVFFKQSQTFKMFPCVDIRRKIDDYGEEIDRSFYRRADEQNNYKRIMEHNTAQLDVGNGRPIEDLTPSSYTVEKALLSIKCEIMYHDLEGRVDGVSVRNIIQQLAPQTMILIHGSKEATKSICDFCLNSESINTNVHAPLVGQTINVTQSSDIYQVVLGNRLFNNLYNIKVGDYEIARFNGILKKPLEEEDSENKNVDEEEEDIDENDKMITDKNEEQDVIRTIRSGKLPTVEVEKHIDYPMHSEQHPSYFFGDIKLSQFRKYLIRENYSCQFVSGYLVVQEGKHKVLVHRKSAGQLSVLGNPSPIYYKVRAMVYSQLASI